MTTQSEYTLNAVKIRQWLLACELGWFTLDEMKFDSYVAKSSASIVEERLLCYFYTDRLSKKMQYVSFTSSDCRTNCTPHLSHVPPQRANYANNDQRNRRFCAEPGPISDIESLSALLLRWVATVWFVCHEQLAVFVRTVADLLSYSCIVSTTKTA